MFLIVEIFIIHCLNNFIYHCKFSSSCKIRNFLNALPVKTNIKFRGFSPVRKFLKSKLVNFLECAFIILFIKETSDFRSPSVETPKSVKCLILVAALRFSLFDKSLKFRFPLDFNKFNF